MKLSRVMIALYVTLVFASGAVLGAFGHRLYTVSAVSANTRRNPEEFRKQYISEMQSRLNLTHDQLVQLNSILDQTRSRFKEAHARMDPELDRIRAEQQLKVRDILQSPQQVEYDKMRQERDERMRREGHPPGPGL